jgi:hypothetical protein
MGENAASAGKHALQRIVLAWQARLGAVFGPIESDVALAFCFCRIFRGEPEATPAFAGACFAKKML